MTHKVPYRAVLAVAVCAALLNGCAPSGDDSTSDKEPAKLKVVYYNESQFYDQFGMLFSATHPNVEIEVVTPPNMANTSGQPVEEADMDKFYEEQKPDIIMLSPQEVEKKAQDGKLYDLTEKIEDESYDKDTLIPGMLDYLRDMGAGKVYSLAPSIYSQAIYYNKDLFEKMGVPLPTDKMTWEQALQLANRFKTSETGKDKIYGLKAGYGGDLYSLGQSIGMSQNLNFVDANTLQVTINSDAWKKVFETANDAIQSGVLYFDQPNNMAQGSTYEEYLLQNPFISGKLAMMIDGTYMMDQIKEAQQQIKDKAIKNWDLVTVPVDPQNPDSSPSISLGQMFAISATSENKDAAWEFLSYITSDEFARVTAKRNRGELSIRTGYLKDDAGHNVQAFQALRPMEASIYKNYEKIPQKFSMEFYGMAQLELKAAQDGQKTVSEALDSLQAKGQELMTTAKQEDDAKKPASPAPSASESAQATESAAAG